jgi:hypothetical protein
MNKTIILNIQNGTFPAATIPPGTHVVWRNLDPVPHSAETDKTSDLFFNAGPMLPGETSAPVHFLAVGTTAYRCRYHSGMNGTVTVAEGAPANGTIEVPDPHGHGQHGGHDHPHVHPHLHGFVTGGRSGTRLFMSHTPVLADPRHCYQVILQGRLTEQKHIDAYNAIRASGYGDRRIQFFHEHITMPDIGTGAITLLPKAEASYYPDLKHPDDGVPIPGLEENIPVTIDRVLHFHKFDVDADYPDGLSYLVYGDLRDVFIDHYLERAPGFHSVAKLASCPAFWNEEATLGTMKILVPSKKIQPLPAKLLQRVAFVDNSFHIFWLPPSGLYTPAPQDPLFPRKPKDPDDGPLEYVGGPFDYDVVLPDGSSSKISVERSLHFDVRLLNHGVFLKDSA